MRKQKHTTNTKLQTKNISALQEQIVAMKTLTVDQLRATKKVQEMFTKLCEYLNAGTIRAAVRDKQGVWHANSWVKEGILIGMRLGVVIPMSSEKETLKFSDKDTLPLQKINAVERNIRIVPGGSSIRNGAYIGDGVIAMAPSYINIGAYIGKGTMIDSHALVGSCAQVGEQCHISAGAQIGGVLEPVNANPCIVEDRVMMGINTSIAEGVILRSGVVLAPGVQITSATRVYDVVRKKIYDSSKGPLTIPENAVIVPGVRPMSKQTVFTKKYNLMIATPIIIKYRDASTDAKTALEGALR